MKKAGNRIGSFGGYLVRLLVASVILQSSLLVPLAANAADQSSYRWRNDNGSETTATWQAAQNVKPNVLRGDTERLRFSVKHDSNDADVTSSLRLNSGDDSYYSSVIDTSNDNLYVGTVEHPARILKFVTSGGAPYPAPSVITLPTGEDNLYAAAIDATNTYAYFVTSTSPSKVIKVDLSTFTVDSTMTLAAGGDYVGGGTIFNGYLYLLTRTNSGKLLKINLSTFTQVTADTVDLGLDLVYSSSVPVANNNKLYFSNGSSVINRYDISSPGSSAPSSAGSITIPLAIDAIAAYTTVYGLEADSTNDDLYAMNYYGRLHKIDTATFTYTDYIDLSVSALSGAAAIDESAGKLYVGSYGTGLARVDTASFLQDTYTSTLDYANVYKVLLSASGAKLFTVNFDAPGHILEIDTTTAGLPDVLGFAGATFGDAYIETGVVDTSTNTGYYGTASSGGRGDSIVRVNLATMTRTGRIDLPSNYNFFYASAIDMTAGFAYFIDYTAPSHLVKLDLSSFTYTTLTLPADGPYYYHYDSMVIDPNPAHHYLYLASYGVPTAVTQIDLNTFTRGSSISLSSSPMEDRNSGAMAIDTINHKLYVGAGSGTGRLVRMDVSGSNLTREAALSLGGAGANPSSALIDQAGGILYVAGGSTNIFKINISGGTTLSIVDSLTVGGTDDYIYGGAIDLASGYAFFGGASTPGKVFRVNLSPFSYDGSEDIIAPNGEEYVITVNVDTAAGEMYFASYQSPSLITKVTTTPNRRLRLEYAPKNVTCAASTFTAVQSGNAWAPMTSPNVTNGAATTNVAAGLTDPAGTFKAGFTMSASGQTPYIHLNTDRFTEVEYAFKAMPSATLGDYCFRLTDAGTPADFTYANYAEATLKSNDATLANSGTLSTLAAGQTSTVTIAFTLQNDFPTGTLTVTFPGAFTGITAPTASLGTCTLNTFGASGQTMTAEKSGCLAGQTVILTGGTVVNPATPGLYTINWTNDDPGYTIVAIVDSDQVTVSATISPSITFDLNTGLTNAGGPPYAVPLGSLAVGTVKSSDNAAINSIWANLTTNATSGALVTVLNANGTGAGGGLRSVSVPTDTIPNSAATMASGVANYGLCVNDTTSTAAGTYQAAGPYAVAGTCAAGGTANDVEALSDTIPTSILDSAGAPITTGVAEIFVNASISTSTAAHSDYTDVLTFVATGTF